MAAANGTSSEQSTTAPKRDVKFADPEKVRRVAREIAKRDRELLDRLAR